MVTVEFLGPIGKDAIKLEASSLSDISEKLKQDSDLRDWLEQCAVAVNDEIVFNRDIELKNGDKISLLPPVCGG